MKAARQPLAYGVVSGLCLLLHNAVLIAGDHARLPLWAGVLMSFALVSLVGYALHSRLTFREPLSARRYLRYALAMSANVPLAYLATWLWRDLAGLAMVLAAPLASASMLAVNYALSHWAIRAPGRERRA